MEHFQYAKIHRIVCTCKSDHIHSFKYKEMIKATIETIVAFLGPALEKAIIYPFSQKNVPKKTHSFALLINSDLDTKTYLRHKEDFESVMGVDQLDITEITKDFAQQILQRTTIVAYPRVSISHTSLCGHNMTFMYIFPLEKG